MFSARPGRLKNALGRSRASYRIIAKEPGLGTQYRTLAKNPAVGGVKAVVNSGLFGGVSILANIRATEAAQRPGEADWLDSRGESKVSASRSWFWSRRLSHPAASSLPGCWALLTKEHKVWLVLIIFVT